MVSGFGAVARTGVHARAARTAAAVRIVAGLVFVGFSVPKFADHEREAAAFARFGFPEPGAIVYAVGALELVAGLLLVLGVAVRLAAAALAVDMLGAVSTAGVAVGGPIHLGLAPALFLAMLFLLWAGRAQRRRSSS